METKKKFLEKFDDLQFIQNLKRDDIKEIEVGILKEKEIMKSLKQEESRLVNEVKQAAENVILARDLETKQNAQIAELKKQIQKLQGEVDILSKQKYEKPAMTVEEGQKILETQTEKIKQMALEIELAKEEKKKRSEKIEEMNTIVEQKRKLKDIKQAEARETLSHIALRDSSLDEVYNWYKSAVEVIKSLSGCHFIVSDDKKIIFDFLNARKHRITIKFDKEKRVEKVLTDGNIRIHDIVDNCTSDVARLIKELCARIESWENREAEFEELGKK